MTETIEQQIQSLEKHLSSQPRSPLFAQLASYYLDAGKAREALDLCDKGLSIYPFYSTAHLIKGKALLGLNMRAEARREFELVQNSLPVLDSITRILRELPSDDLEVIIPSVSEPPEPQTAEVPPQPAEPIAAETNPDQWLSQFTEAAEAPAQEPALSTEQAEAPATTETFSFPGENAVEAPAEATLQPEDAFGAAPPQEATLENQPPEAALTGEPFADFAERKRGELFGLENSMTLDEYFGSGQPPAEMPAENMETPIVAESPQSPSEDPFAAVTEQFGEAPAETVEAPAADPFAALTSQFEEPPAETPSESVQEPSVLSEIPESPGEDPFAALTSQFEEPPAEVIPESVTETPASSESLQTPPEDPFAALHQQFEETATEPQAEQITHEPHALEERPAEELMPSAEQPQREKNDIEELADKLKNAKKITPIIDLSERTAVPPSEADTPSGTGFVTPTLAEIYAKQGWFDDAIKAYKTLAISKPVEKEKFEKRIKELEELKNQQQS